MDRSRARKRDLSLNFETVLDVIETSLAAGAQGLTFTVNPESRAILRGLKQKNFEKRFGLYPLVPDIQTYRKAISEGRLDILGKELVRDLSLAKISRMLIRAGKSIIETSPLQMLQLYVDAEIDRLLRVAPTGARVRVVLVHEIMTDMAISLNGRALIEALMTHLTDSARLTPGFVTRNLSRFVEVWNNWGFPYDQVVIMTPLNRLGFQMTPSRESCEQALEKMKEARIIAMSPLAAGRLSLTDGIGYLRTLDKVASVAIGVSSITHANETFAFLSQTMNK